MATQKKLIKDFGERYSIIEWKEGDAYVLYDKETPSKRSNYTYLGVFSISKEKYVFNEKIYDTTTELISAMGEYNETLPFSADIYNPLNRKNIGVELALHDYLKELGFEIDRCDDVYTLKDMYGQIVYSIRFEVREDTTKGTITHNIPNTFGWEESSFTDLESAIGAVNSLVATYGISTNSKIVDMLGKITTARATQVFDKVFSIKDFELYTQNAKQRMIDELEKELKRLKGELN